ncbi:MAG: dihydroorotate dehydrogenase electron transfer subunit [Promethearchaeia archaeon]|nr:MAG: dihydroorotate dehydrogenase electron transfer subunit [Candidatus Lokiarchaeia archaeon]
MPITPNKDYRLNKPFSTPILDIQSESPTVKTFIVMYNPIPEKIHYKPGQFVMVWIPGLDEIPMSVARYFEDGRIAISVAKVGDATIRLFQLQIGDIIGIRGPYGNGYEVNPGTAVIVGGGIGMASVLSIFYAFHDIFKSGKETNSKIICIIGARTAEELLFEDAISKILPQKVDIHLCTDDGSRGFHGFTTEKLKEVLLNDLGLKDGKPQVSPITIYACGPELMLKKIVDLGINYKIPVQVSLERMMRCGFGICGLCALDPTGLLVCRDGPVFTAEQLQPCTDFGRIHRDFAGKPLNI